MPKCSSRANRYRSRSADEHSQLFGGGGTSFYSWEKISRKRCPSPSSSNTAECRRGSLFPSRPIRRPSMKESANGHSLFSFARRRRRRNLCSMSDGDGSNEIRFKWPLLHLAVHLPLDPHLSTCCKTINELQSDVLKLPMGVGHDRWELFRSSSRQWHGNVDVEVLWEQNRRKCLLRKKRTSGFLSMVVVDPISGRIFPPACRVGVTKEFDLPLSRAMKEDIGFIVIGSPTSKDEGGTRFPSPSPSLDPRSAHTNSLILESRDCRTPSRRIDRVSEWKNGRKRSVRATPFECGTSVAWPKTSRLFCRLILSQSSRIELVRAMFVS